MAEAEHPSLIDEAHLLDELLGVVNVPSGVWIDEQGVIVRPPEPAFPGRVGVDYEKLELPEGTPAAARGDARGDAQDPNRSSSATWRRSATGRRTAPAAASR